MCCLSKHHLMSTLLFNGLHICKLDLLGVCVCACVFQCFSVRVEEAGCARCQWLEQKQLNGPWRLQGEIEQLP